MAQNLSPGIFMSERSAPVQVIQSVSASTLAVVGFTEKGPTDTATIVTSFEQFQSKFGGLVPESYTPIVAAAGFANGVQQMVVVRVVPSDAVSATAFIQSQTTNQLIETGDGSNATFTKTASSSVLKDNAGASPLIGETVSIRWRAAGSPVSTEQLKQRNGTTNAVGNGALLNFDLRINPASLPTFDEALEAIVPGSVVLRWTSSGAKTLTIAATTSPTATATNGAGSTATIDLRSGRISVAFDATEVPSSASINADFTPATATKTIVDDGAGALTGAALTGAGTIDYNTGAYSFIANSGDKPHLNARVLATYQINAWALHPISAGKWANNLKVEIRGNIDGFTASTSSYTIFNVLVRLFNATTNQFDIVESFDEVSFSDTSSDKFFADVINQSSKYLTVDEPGGDEVALQLNGIPRRHVIAGGSEVAANQIITSATADNAISLAGASIAPRSVIISFTASDGTAKEITDDGSGNLTGDIDASYTTEVTAGSEDLAANAMSYTTGAFNFKTSNLVKANTLVTVVYASTPSETIHTETLGDTTKDYTAGSDGTFTSGTYGRSQLTSSTALSSSFKGIFALNKLDTIMNVVVPDSTGNVTMTLDLLDYADARATQPAGGDRFIILSVPAGLSAQQAADWFRFSLNRFSDFAAIYAPWVKIADPLNNNRPGVFPVVGHIGGIYARTDQTKNVAKSPGGIVDGALKFIVGLETEFSQSERDILYPSKINPLISSPQTGLAVWGVRTISNQSDWRYIAVRRLFMFLEKSIFNSTHWIVFENNGPALWARIKSQLLGFLGGLFGDGLFAGNKPQDAFFVIVDETNNTDETIAQGRVIIDLGVAPTTPAEFVEFRIAQLQNTAQ